MKTKENIEQLAESAINKEYDGDHLRPFSSEAESAFGFRRGFIAGYQQAQDQCMPKWIDGDVNPIPLKTVLADYGEELLVTAFYQSNQWFCHVKEWNGMKPKRYIYAHSTLPNKP